LGGSQSLRALEEAWRRSPESTFVRLAGAYREHGRLDDAVRVVERGLTRRPGHLAGRVLLARVQLDRGEFAAAEAILTALLEAHPDHWEAGWLLVRVRRADGRRDEERDALLDLQRLHPGHHEVYAALARLDADLAFRPALPDTERRPRVDSEAVHGQDDDSTDLSMQAGGTGLGPPWKPAMGRKQGHRLPGRLAPPPRGPEPDPFLNATMAELLSAQGDPEGARAMYRELLQREPDKESHRARFIELGGAVDDAPDPEGGDEPDPRMLVELLEGIT
jgi:predicted Zn-dependent protease